MQTNSVQGDTAAATQDSSGNSAPAAMVAGDAIAIPHPQARARLGRLIGGVYRQWRRHVDQSVKGLGLTDALRAPLLALHAADAPMRQKDLAQALLLETSSLVRVLDQLRAMDLVDWECDPADRRTKCIALTADGQQTVARILAKSMEIERRILVDLTPEELALVRSALEKISLRLESL